MKKDKRRVFLDKYGNSLAALVKAHQYEIKLGSSKNDAIPITHNIYICPLCMKNFFYFKDGEYFESETFSEDHFPPESVKGFKTVLVCKPCNNVSGSEMDYVLKEYLEFKAFLDKKENASYPLKFSYKGIPGNYNIISMWQDGKLVQDISFKKYPFIGKWALNPERENLEFKIKISAPQEKTIQQALLRAAYLHCFSNWGYDFSYSKTAQHIRNVLTGNETHPLKNLGVFGVVNNEGPDEGFYFINSPKDYHAFIISFKISISNPDFSTKIFVVIPGSDKDAWDRFLNFDSWIETKVQEMQLLILDKNCVRQGSYLDYSITWSKLFSQENN